MLAFFFVVKTLYLGRMRTTRFAKGGVTKGPSHKEGGIPMTVKSTGQQVELEGGEGVVNKAVMASQQQVVLNGEKLSPCEAVSEINQMAGNGVDFECPPSYDSGGIVQRYDTAVMPTYPSSIGANASVNDVERMAEGGHVSADVDFDVEQLAAGIDDALFTETGVQEVLQKFAKGGTVTPTNQPSIDNPYYSDYSQYVKLLQRTGSLKALQIDQKELYRHYGFVVSDDVCSYEYSPFMMIYEWMREPETHPFVTPRGTSTRATTLSRIRTYRGQVKWDTERSLDIAQRHYRAYLHKIFLLDTHTPRVQQMGHNYELYRTSGYLRENSRYPVPYINTTKFFNQASASPHIPKNHDILNAPNNYEGALEYASFLASPLLQSIFEQKTYANSKMCNQMMHQALQKHLPFAKEVAANCAFLEEQLSENHIAIQQLSFTTSNKQVISILTPFFNTSVAKLFTNAIEWFERVLTNMPAEIKEISPAVLHSYLPVFKNDSHILFYNTRENFCFTVEYPNEVEGVANWKQYVKAHSLKSYKSETTIQCTQYPAHIDSLLTDNQTPQPAANNVAVYWQAKRQQQTNEFNTTGSGFNLLDSLVSLLAFPIGYGSLFNDAEALIKQTIPKQTIQDYLTCISIPTHQAWLKAWATTNDQRGFYNAISNYTTLLVDPELGDLLIPIAYTDNTVGDGRVSILERGIERLSGGVYEHIAVMQTACGLFSPVHLTTISTANSLVGWLLNRHLHIDADYANTAFRKMLRFKFQNDSEKRLYEYLSLPGKAAYQQNDFLAETKTQQALARPQAVVDYICAASYFTAPWGLDVTDYDWFTKESTFVLTDFPNLSGNRERWETGVQGAVFATLELHAKYLRILKLADWMSVPSFSDVASETSKWERVESLLPSKTAKLIDDVFQELEAYGFSTQQLRTLQQLRAVNRKETKQKRKLQLASDKAIPQAKFSKDELNNYDNFKTVISTAIYESFLSIYTLHQNSPFLIPILFGGGETNTRYKGIYAGHNPYGVCNLKVYSEELMYQEKQQVHNTDLDAYTVLPNLLTVQMRMYSLSAAFEVQEKELPRLADDIATNLYGVLRAIDANEDVFTLFPNTAQEHIIDVQSLKKSMERWVTNPDTVFVVRPIDKQAVYEAEYSDVDLGASLSKNNFRNVAQPANWKRPYGIQMYMDNRDLGFGFTFGQPLAAFVQYRGKGQGDKIDRYEAAILPIDRYVNQVLATQNLAQQFIGPAQLAMAGYARRTNIVSHAEHWKSEYSFERLAYISKSNDRYDNDGDSISFAYDCLFPINIADKNTRADWEYIRDVLFPIFAASHGFLGETVFGPFAAPYWGNADTQDSGLAVITKDNLREQN